METADTTSPPPPITRPSASTERTIAALTHLSGFLVYVTGLGHVIAPLVVWLVYKETSPRIAHHAKEALNFQISLTIYGIVATLLILSILGAPFGLLALLILPILGAVLMIVAAVQSADNVRFRYPLTIRLVP